MAAANSAPVLFEPAEDRSVLLKSKVEAWRSQPEITLEDAAQLLKASSELRVLEAGYDPITLKTHDGWSLGFVEDPRPFPWAAWISQSFQLKLTLSLVACLLVGLVSNSIVVLFTSTLSVLALVAISLLIDWFVNKPAIPVEQEGQYKTFRVFQPALPKAARMAYLKAKRSGVFKRIEIYAPSEVFLNKKVYVDPVIIGRDKDGNPYLIAQFDLGEDRQRG